MPSIMNFALIVSLMLVLVSKESLADEVVPDPNLRAVLQKILEKKQLKKETIDPADLKSIYFLDARGEEIKDLTGLEHCANLAELKLSDNQIGDVTPLAKLNNIQSLYLSNNEIKDLKPLADLVKIQYLEIEGNGLESLEGIEQMTNLRALYAEKNKISDVSPLANAKRLVSLNLNDNQVASLAPIGHLTWVSTLGLKNNQVSDLKPIAEWRNLHFTFLQGNPLEKLDVLVQMAKQDFNSEKQFAPFWFLFLDVDLLPETAQKQVDELKEYGVRINQKN